jgi:U3 small nucleolar RNA-associated protein 21
VCVSACGNFGFAGGADGIVEMWNLQSGVKRKTFQLGTAPTSGTRRTKLARRSDNRVVTGIATDSLNRILISATLDGSVNVSPLQWWTQLIGVN